MPQQFHPTDSDKGKRLDVFLGEQLSELSRSRIQQLLADGKIQVTGGLEGKEAKPGYKLRGTETIRVEETSAPPLRAFAEKIPLDILYEDADMVAVNKPAGMVVHSGAGVNSGTLVNALLNHFKALSTVSGDLRPGIVHRLDRDTSGVLLVAKNDAAHHGLAEQFSSRSMEKTYVALVHGVMKDDAGVIRSAIRRDPSRRVRMVVRPEGTEGSREAESRWRAIRRYKGFTLLEVRIITGRTHQVRVHLASIGHPVAGDRLYGAPGAIPAALLKAKAQKKAADSPTLDRNFLHAARMRLSHPITGEALEIRAPLPAALDDFLKRLLPDEAAAPAKSKYPVPPHRRAGAEEKAR